MFKGKTWLLVRVAESIAQKEGVIFFPALNATGNTEIIEVPLNDPDNIATDARVINYKGEAGLFNHHIPPAIIIQ